jgi:hypothetical protein
VRFALVLGFSTGCQLVFPLRDTPPSDGTVIDAPVTDAPPDISGPVRIVFASSTKYTGNMGGLDAADQECQQAALAIAGVDNKRFIAWLSTDQKSIAERLTPFEGGYVLPADSGVVVFHQAELLINLTNLVHPIDHTEGGAPAAESKTCGGRGVWTGTTRSGATTNVNCANWTSENGTGSSGNDGATDDAWVDDPACRAIDCAAQQSVYCVEN